MFLDHHYRVRSSSSPHHSLNPTPKPRQLQMHLNQTSVTLSEPYDRPANNGLYQSSTSTLDNAFLNFYYHWYISHVQCRHTRKHSANLHWYHQKYFIGQSILEILQFCVSCLECCWRIETVSGRLLHLWTVWTRDGLVMSVWVRVHCFFLVNQERFSIKHGPYCQKCCSLREKEMPLWCSDQ